MRRFPVRPAAVLISLLLAAPALAPSITAQVDNPAFQRTWERTDRAVADGTVSRTWIWGELVTETTLMEAYEEGPGGQRQVLYYDKARMEDNSWRAPDAPWDVTNGLLVVELATGMLQSGDADFVERAPSDHNVAGDADDPTGPTYTTIAGLMDEPSHPDGATIDWTVVRDGTTGQDSSLGAQNVTAGPLSPETGHRTASVFWEFMNSSGPVWVDEQLVTDTLFPTAYYATGLPITEAYWASVKVAGTYRIVLLQCFERRCLTFTPDNPDGWQTEMGNVGQHYHAWRYTMEQRYEVLFGSLNDSGVTGSAELTLVGNELTIEFNVSGLEPGQPHAVHVYGNLPESQSRHMQQAGPADCPVQEADGVVGFEGLRIFDVSDPTSPVPVADESGNLETSLLLVGPGPSLDSQVIGLHGRTLGDEYDDALPVACGRIEQFGAHEFGDYYHAHLDSVNDSEVQSDLAFWLHQATAGDYSSFADYRATARDPDPILGSEWSTYWYNRAIFGDASTCPDPAADTADTNGDGVVDRDEIEAHLAVNDALLTELGWVDEDGDGVREAQGALYVEIDEPENLVFVIYDEETDLPLACGVSNPVGPGTQFGAFLAGAEEFPPVETNASGLVIFEWQEDNTFSYDLIVTGLDEVTAAHIHTGVFGQNGPVSLPLFTPDAPTGPVNGMLVEDGVIDPAESIDPMTDWYLRFISGGTYANLHTSEHQSGELRGQVAFTVPDVYTTGLYGDQVIPPVDTEMSGSVAFLIAPDQSTVSFQLIISNGVDVTSAHIHLGEPGENGEAVVTLYDLETHGPRPESGVLWQGPILATVLGGPLIDESIPSLIERFEAGEVYVDVHTEAHPDGEIRGQPRQ